MAEKASKKRKRRNEVGWMRNEFDAGGEEGDRKMGKQKCAGWKEVEFDDTVQLANVVYGKKKRSKDGKKCRTGKKGSFQKHLLAIESEDAGGKEKAIREEHQEEAGERCRENDEECRSSHNIGAELAEKRRRQKKRVETVHHMARFSSKTVQKETTNGRTLSPTVSIAVAGSIINNAQSVQLATMLAGQIARAAAIFRIDEVVVFDDSSLKNESQMKRNWLNEEFGESPGFFLVRILQHLEIPQYLRHALAPRHKSLRCVGLLPPLDAPHHARKHEWPAYREGVVLDKAVQSGFGSYVDVGIEKEVLIQQSFSPGTRVTVAMGSSRYLSGKNGTVLRAVHRTEPKDKAGLYWGYTVRHAACLSAVFTDCMYKDGYDYCIGTSEHGDKVASTDLDIPKFKHMLIAFGGLAGLEENVELDKSLKVVHVSSLFDKYLNTCPNQGSRTIRTEEAILISLQYFQDPIQRAIHASV